MKRFLIQTILFAAFFVGSLHAQSPDDIAATWQGTFQSGNEEHRTVLQIEKAETGWKARDFEVEFVPDWLQIDSLTFQDGNVKLSTNGGKGIYQGKLSADGSAIAGTWTYNKYSAPLELRRATTATAWHTPFQYQYHFKEITIQRPSVEEANIPFSPRLALDYMEQGATAWTGERQCVACHTNGSYMVVRPLMSAKFGPPQQEIHDYFVSALKQQLTPDPDDPKWEPASSQVVYIAAGLAIWDGNVTHRLSPETSQALELMFKLQRPTGDWYIDDDNNPPLESNTFQLATVAARAIGNAPGWLSQQQGTPIQAKIDCLKKFLRAEQKLQGDYDRTDLLWASSELPGLLDARREQQLVDMIFSHQQADGGWSIRTFAKPEEWGKGNRADKLKAEIEFTNPPKDGPSSDGHMTGLAIIALRKSGVPASDPHIQRGIAWLQSNQRASGRWWTRSLNRDGWQFISYSSTVYPLLALDLCNALPANLQTAGSPQNGIAAGR